MRRETNGNLERAGDWLMSHMDDLASMDVDEDQPQQPQAEAPAQPSVRDIHT